MSLTSDQTLQLIGEQTFRIRELELMNQQITQQLKQMEENNARENAVTSESNTEIKEV